MQIILNNSNNSSKVKYLNNLKEDSEISCCDFKSIQQMVASTHYTCDGGGNFSDEHGDDKQKIYSPWFGSVFVPE